MGHFGRGVGLQRERGFTVTGLIVGVPNKLQMARNLTGGLPVLYQGRLANFRPFRECLTPAHNERRKGTPEGIGAPDCKMVNGEKARMQETNTYAK